MPPADKLLAATESGNYYWGAGGLLGAVVGSTVTVGPDVVVVGAVPLSVVVVAGNLSVELVEPVGMVKPVGLVEPVAGPGADVGTESPPTIMLAGVVPRNRDVVVGADAVVGGLDVVEPTMTRPSTYGGWVVDTPPETWLAPPGVGRDDEECSEFMSATT